MQGATTSTAELTGPGVAARRRPPRQAAMDLALGRSLARAERVYVVVSLFLFSRALVPLLLEAGGGSIGFGAGNVVLRGIYLAIEAVALVLVVVNWRSVLATLGRHLPTVVLVGFALASVLWSVDPALTLRRSFALVGTTAFGVYLAARFDTREQLRLLAAALGLVALMSAAFGALMPAYGINQAEHAGAWQGVFTHKNNLGRIMVLSAVVFALALPSLRRRWIGWAGLGLSVALVLLSTSKTALALLLSFVLLAPLFRALRLRAGITALVLIGFVLTGGTLAAALAANADAVFRIMGRDASLTGRVPLWDTVLAAIAERPWLGHGYSAFWTGIEGPSYEVWKRIQWVTPHSHNGVLDLGLELGWIGVALFLAGLAVALARAVRAARGPAGIHLFWPLAFLLFTVMSNVTESSILQQNSIFWVLYVSAAFSALLRGGEDAEPAPLPEPGAGPAPPASRPSPGVRRRLARASLRAG